MTATQLNDEAMDSIVGGSSYMSDLAGFLQTGYNGQPCFQMSYNTGSTAGNMACPASDKGMELLIRNAERHGKITLTAANGTKKDFTAAELKAMQ